MELKGYYNEDVLSELLYKEEITHLEYIYHHSKERIDDFKEYCEENGFKEDEMAAENFFDELLKREEESHLDNME